MPAIDLEDPSSWLIGFDGIGPVAQGGPIAEVRPAMAAFVEDELPEWCPAARFKHDGALTLVAHLSDDFSTVTGMSLSGWDSSMDVSNSSPHTAEGIRIGSSLAELLAAYPDIAKSGEYGGGEDPTLFYAVPGDARVWIVFSLYDDTVRGIFVRDTPTPPSEYCS
ncbi:hypothetical protein [Microterricola viridarii]|uniref:hypothetical protein n=1 Tax=Microterricola viridarii TaxID=412690 RepID=UPI000AC8EEDB|nr:hypothetical protein [Microterricola viridarii]